MVVAPLGLALIMLYLGAVAVLEVIRVYPVVYEINGSELVVSRGDTRVVSVTLRDVRSSNGWRCSPIRHDLRDSIPSKLAPWPSGDLR